MAEELPAWLWAVSSWNGAAAFAARLQGKADIELPVP
jgi:hypothetical protein